MAELLVESGYCEIPDQVAEAAIASALTENPNIVDDWLAYSEDKRVTSGWFFKIERPGQFVVGSEDERSSGMRSTEYSDRIEACAKFIKEEVESIRHGLGSRS